MSDRRLTEQSAPMIRCVECASTSDDGCGWRAYLTIDNEVAVHYPECAAREFGGP